MKKNPTKRIFFITFFFATLWLCISKMICKTWEGIPIMEKNWERFTKVFDDKIMFDNGPIYPIGPTFIKNHYDLVMS